MLGFNRLIGKTPQGLVGTQGVGDSILNPAPGIFVTDANSVIPAATLVSGLYFRNGITAARTDTTDTAANITANMPGMDPGDCFLLMVSVQPAFALTLAGGTGVTLLGTKTSIPASGFGIVMFRKVSDIAYTFSVL